MESNSEIPEALKVFVKHFENQNQKVEARTQILKMDFKLLQKYPIVSMFVTPSNPGSPDKSD